jgi:diguanylate cyclase (GGDEF)-like protein
MEYSLKEIFDLSILTSSCQSFTDFSGLGTAILDLKGNVLVATGWQPICTQFHRVHPETSKNCLESDTILSASADNGSRYNIYRCKNGLIDVAIPIYLNKQHIATFFTGQFFLEAPNQEEFKAQAHKYKFDETIYMESLNKVKVFNEEEVKRHVEYLVTLTELFAQMGLNKINAIKKSMEYADHLSEIVKDKTRKLEQANIALARVNGELASANKELEHLSLKDTLTGLYNRRAFNQYFEREWDLARRNGTLISMLMIDVDDFKLFNDTYGHVAGDNCLIDIATVVQDSVNRPTDFVVRYGGEELACILPNTDIHGAKNIAQLIQQNIADLAIEHKASTVSENVTVSIGIASTIPVDGVTSIHLTKASDECLYEAKERGKNQIVVHSGSSSN